MCWINKETICHEVNKQHFIIQVKDAKSRLKFKETIQAVTQNAKEMVQTV